MTVGTDDLVDSQSQHLGDGVGHRPRGGLARLAVTDQVVRPVNGCRHSSELAEGPQQFDPLVEVGGHRVEDAHHVEVLTESRPPRLDMVGPADRIDQRQPG